MTTPTQQKQTEWVEQWSLFQDQELFLFQEWMHPLKLAELKNLEVLEAGCGGGQHTFFMAPYAKKITAVDLNTVAIARERNHTHENIEFIEADIATMNLEKQFDVVISIGVIHHTDDPNKTVENLIRHVKPGGKLVIWIYSREGNFLVEYGVEPARRLLLRRMPRAWVYRLSQLITAGMMLPIHTVYRLPLKFLPFYEYFKNFRKLSFSRNVLNVFDKLNAPQVQFISREQVSHWFSEDKFKGIHLSSYCGVSWRASGCLKQLSS